MGHKSHTPEKPKSSTPVQQSAEFHDPALDEFKTPFEGVAKFHEEKLRNPDVPLRQDLWTMRIIG